MATANENIKWPAPSVTPESIEAVIANEYYFTAGDAVTTACGAVPAHYENLSLLTFCVLVLKNGFTVTGESSCVSPENFDAEVGRKIARAKAFEKIWVLEGYLLQQRLSDAGDSDLDRSAQQPASPFKPGDVVRLKSGGLKMTVWKIDGNEVHCVWANDAGSFDRGFFRAIMLALAG